MYFYLYFFTYMYLLETVPEMKASKRCPNKTRKRILELNKTWGQKYYRSLLTQSSKVLPDLQNVRLIVHG